MDLTPEYSKQALSLSRSFRTLTLSRTPLVITLAPCLLYRDKPPKTVGKQSEQTTTSSWTPLSSFISSSSTTRLVTPEYWDRTSPIVVLMTHASLLLRGSLILWLEILSSRQTTVTCLFHYMMDTQARGTSRAIGRCSPRSLALLSTLVPLESPFNLEYQSSTIKTWISGDFNRQDSCLSWRLLMIELWNSIDSTLTLTQ